MANTFNPVIMYKDIIDEYFKQNDRTDVFDKPENYENGEYKILKITAGGLGDYVRQRSQSQGVSYAANEIGNGWESIKADKERSTQILIDKADDLETFSAVFDGAIRQFLQKAVVEREARRHAAIAQSTAGITKVDVDVSTAEHTLAALREASNVLFNNHVPLERRVTIIRGDVYSAIADLDTYKSKAVLSELGQIIEVTPDTMYEDIVLSPTNGYEKAEGAKDIAFIIASKDSLVSGTHWDAQFFDEGQVQDYRGSKYNYYEQPLNAHVYDNKAKGVYVGTINF